VIGDDPSKYYFHSTPCFETGDERYLWLNKIIAICSGGRTPDAVPPRLLQSAVEFLPK
jgi:hypothetical protein